MRKKLIVGITAPGSVVLLEGQLKYFKSLNYETYLIAPQDERTIRFCQNEGCTLLPVDIKREISLVSDLRSLFKIIRYFKKIRPDVVNVGTPKMGLLGILGAKITGVKKRIYTCRGFRFEHEKGVKKMILLFIEKVTAIYAREVICISDSVKELGNSYRLFSEKKAVVIHKGSSNGISLDRFNPATIDIKDTASLKKDLSIQGCFVFGYVGRLIDRKGINELYASFSRMFENHKNIRLLFVGSPEMEQIKDKELLNKLNQHPGIILAGSQRNVPLYLSVMDVFVLPAWWEGFGNVLVQAAAMGVPVISTTGTGSRDAVKENFNGILVSPGSVQELVQAMELLYRNEELRNTYGKNGIEWAKHFDNKIIWEGMEKIYQS